MEWFVGIILPPVIDYVNKAVLTDEEKVTITVLLCLIVACVLDWSLIQKATWRDTQSVLTLGMVLVGEAMTVYKLYWKNSKLRQVLPGNGVPNS